MATMSSKASSASLGEKPAATSRSSAPFDEGHVDEAVGGDGSGVDETGVLQGAGAQGAGEGQQPLVPRGEIRHRDPLEHRRADEPEELFATGDVVVERGHRHTESLRHRRHRDLLGAGLRRELHRGAHDAVSVDACRASRSAAGSALDCHGPVGYAAPDPVLLPTVTRRVRPEVQHAGDDRYTLISADTHAGGSVRGYKPYLESKWHDDFDKWAGDGRGPVHEMGAAAQDRRREATPADDMNRNWDSERRLKEMHEDGVVAEVIFPNTQPPFAPLASSSLQARSSLRRRRAALGRASGPTTGGSSTSDNGARAPRRHRADVPERRARHGRRARVGEGAGAHRRHPHPGCPPGSGMVPLYAASTSRSGRYARDLDVVHTHSGSGVPDFGPYHPVATAMFMLEVRWWAHRPLWALIFEGVFQRHPELQFVIAESGVGVGAGDARGARQLLRPHEVQLDSPEFIFGGECTAPLDLKPSEYFARQCHIAASFLRPNEVRCVTRSASTS